MSVNPTITKILERCIGDAIEKIENECTAVKIIEDILLEVIRKSSTWKINLEIVESCLSEAIEVIEKEVEIEEEAVRKYREIEINREKNLEMGTVKLEIERMMRVEKGERLRKVPKKKEKEKMKKMARDGR